MGIPSKCSIWIIAILLASTLGVRAQTEILVIPLTHTNGWQFLNYRGIPPNVPTATSAGLAFGVTNSASPAIYPLNRQRQVSHLRAVGTIHGALKTPAGKQGDHGFDDYAVRVGLVEAGNRTLNWRERLVAVNWVKTLFALAPPGTGVSKIHFFNVGVDGSQLGRTRTHPINDLMLETISATPDQNGDFAFTNRFDPPMNIIAVWISCDGDDSKSSYSTLLRRLELGATAIVSPK